MRPYVMLANIISLDGCTTGFPANIGLYYGLVGQLGYDGHLFGSNTLITSGAPADPPDVPPAPPVQPTAGDTRPLGIAVDSRGRVRIWGAMRSEGYWRSFVSLCSKQTPADHRAYLQSQSVEAVEVGEERVDLPAALELLGERYGVRRILVDSGGILNSVLLRAGLVDEVHLLMSPHLVGNESAGAFYRSLPGFPPAETIPLRFDGLSQEAEDIVWLRYKVDRKE